MRMSGSLQLPLSVVFWCYHWPSTRFHFTKKDVFKATMRIMYLSISPVIFLFTFCFTYFEAVSLLRCIQINTVFMYFCWIDTCYYEMSFFISSNFIPLKSSLIRLAKPLSFLVVLRICKILFGLSCFGISSCFSIFVFNHSLSLF